MTDSLNILWLKSGPLYPLDSGGKIRTHAMLTEISRHHRVTYLAFKDDNRSLEAEEEPAAYAETKTWIPWSEAGTGSLHFFYQLLSNLLFSTLPYALAKYQSTTMRDQIVQLDASREFDLIVCDFLVPSTNLHLDGSSFVTPTILFQHNIESEIWRRLAETKSNPIARYYYQIQYRRMFRWEEKLSRIFDGIITVSPNDSEFCREQYKLGNVLGEVPTGVDIDFFQPTSCERMIPSQPTANHQPPSPKIAFLGSMDWMPNIECVQYFTRQVLPLIHKEIPEARFVIIGREPAPAVVELAETTPAIELTGSVDDIRPHLQSCNLMVVPLRAGGGTRIKIFEAMAMGVLVVSTTIGAEGLPVSNGENILIADSDEALADACIRIFQDPLLVQRLTNTAREKMEKDHSWQAVSEQFVGLCLRAIN